MHSFSSFLKTYWAIFTSKIKMWRWTTGNRKIMPYQRISAIYGVVYRLYFTLLKERN